MYGLASCLLIQALGQFTPLISPQEKLNLLIKGKQMKLYKKIFYFLFLIPITFLVYEIRETHIDTRESQEDLFLLNAQRASNQHAIMGIQVRILHYVEGHNEEEPFGTCPLCFKNMLLEKYDHELIRKFLRENGIEIKCYGLNEFPKNTIELRDYLVKK